MSRTTYLISVISLVAAGVITQRWQVWSRVFNNRLASANPPQIRFELHVQNDQSRFFIGETIPLELRFSSTLPHTYGFEYSTYDRSGRMPYEIFEVYPSRGFADPLAEYYGTGVLGGLAGGLRSRPVLDSKPISIPAYLNEWIRFDEPGHYRIFARSRFRVRRQVSSATEAHVEYPEIVSNVIELDIIRPDVAWEQQELDRLVVSFDNANEEVRREASQRIRFLGTAGAMSFMARQLSAGNGFGFIFFLGILGSAHRSAARHILEDALVDTTQQINVGTLNLVAYLRVRKWFVILAPIPPEYANRSTSAIWMYQQLEAVYSNIHKRAVRRAARDLADAIPRKTAEARKSCIQTVAYVDPALAESRFSAFKQSAASAELPDTEMSGEEFRRKNAEEFRARILADLRRDSPTLHFRLLAALPDRELPQLEPLFVAHAPKNPWLFGRLLWRYGTDRVYARTHRLYERNHLSWPCDARFPFLAYFLRIRPVEGSATVRSALRERKGNGCFRDVFVMASQFYFSPELELIARESLGDSDPEVAGDAARMLSGYGSADSEAYLWRRLESWVRQWHGRTTELYGNLATGEGSQTGQIRLLNALVDGLETSQAWFFDPPRRQRLYDMCGGDYCRDALTRNDMQGKEVEVRIRQLMYQEPEYYVGPYHPGSLERLHQKVSQFPRGTLFGWCTERDGGGPLSESERKLMFQQARNVIESEGLQLDPNPPMGTCWIDPK